MALTIKPTTRNSTRKDEAIKEIKTEQNVKLTINIPNSLRTKFKIASIKNNTDMSQVILEWIKEYVKP